MEETIDEFPAIRQYFPYQNFPFSWLLTTDKFVAIRLHSKINYITEALSFHATTILYCMVYKKVMLQ